MKYEETILKNGLRIMSLNIPGSKVINLESWILDGSRYEKPDEREYSHLCEHLLMSGSKKFPTELSLAAWEEKTGSYINASTSIEYIKVTVECLPEYVDQAMEFLADKILNPIINEEKLEREIKVLESEYRQRRTDKNQLVYKHSLFYALKGSGIEPMISNDFNIKKPSVKDLQAFYNQKITPDKIVIIIAGNIDAKAAAIGAEKYFIFLEAIPTGGVKPKSEQINIYPIQPKLPGIQGVGHTGINYPISALDDDVIYSLLIINHFLTKGNGGKLKEELRYKKGWVYSVKAYLSLFKGVGLYTVLFTAKEYEKVRDYILDNIPRTISDLDELRLKIIKQNIILTNRRVYFSSQRDQIKDIGYYLSIGKKPRTLNRFEDEVKKVTLEKIKGVAKEYLAKEKAIIIASD